MDTIEVEMIGMTLSCSSGQNEAIRVVLIIVAGRSDWCTSCLPLVMSSVDAHQNRHIYIRRAFPARGISPVNIDV